ncbi:MAG TPA: hypothetical protein PK710_00610 [Polyangiaceae bacterium]|nr:hypothetical protein [Polyangiaceae bacterium]HPY20508.1 hypothetical protein [Polyangiaceae bacterium]HQF25232.1 hypothetical protein [Polyangiaceae bacterium]HQM07762.1 hypothetical protein [Polyangiaceae bacterium]
MRFSGWKPGFRRKTTNALLLGGAMGVAIGMVASEARAKRYTKPAPPMSSYIQNYGFRSPSNPSANLNAHNPQAHSQLEAYLLEGAWAAELTGDPVMVAWFAAADAYLAPWRMSNCGDYSWDIDFDCPVLPWGSNIWQVGLAVQVSDSYSRGQKAFSATHPNETEAQVGNEVLKIAAQEKTFPTGLSIATMVSSPGGITAGMHNSYWFSVLLRDMAMSAYLESPAATAWECYKSNSYPGWCEYYRKSANWQHYSDVLSMVIVSWNQIQEDWKKALVDDVIIDDLDPGFKAPPGAKFLGEKGWRGHFTWREASSSSPVSASWTANLPVAGTWTVSAFIPYSDKATVTKGKVTVEAQDGSHEATLDESQIGGRFVELGTWPFESKAVVRMTNQGTSTECVGWDAVRFHLVSKASPDAGTPDGSAGSGGSGGSSGEDAHADVSGDETTEASADSSHGETGIVSDANADHSDTDARDSGMSDAHPEAGNHPASWPSDQEADGCACLVARNQSRRYAHLAVLALAAIGFGLRRHRRGHSLRS